MRGCSSVGDSLSSGAISGIGVVGFVLLIVFLTICRICIMSRRIVQPSQRRSISTQSLIGPNQIRTDGTHACNVLLLQS